MYSVKCYEETIEDGESLGYEYVDYKFDTLSEAKEFVALTWSQFRNPDESTGISVRTLAIDEIKEIGNDEQPF